MKTLSEVRLLIVEDISSLRLQLKDSLKQAGFIFMEAVKSVPDAKLALDSGEYDLIVCDWHLEPIAGIELLRTIRQDPKLQNLAFVMVTAEKATESVMHAISSGVDAYLLKPLTVNQLHAKVLSALTKRQVI